MSASRVQNGPVPREKDAEVHIRGGKFAILYNSVDTSPPSRLNPPSRSISLLYILTPYPPPSFVNRLTQIDSQDISLDPNFPKTAYISFPLSLPPK